MLKSLHFSIILFILLVLMIFACGDDNSKNLFDCETCVDNQECNFEGNACVDKVFDCETCTSNQECDTQNNTCVDKEFDCEICTDNQECNSEGNACVDKVFDCETCVGNQECNSEKNACVEKGFDCETCTSNEICNIAKDACELIDTSVKNYSNEFRNLKYTIGTQKKLCGYSVRYPDGRGSIDNNRYKTYLETFSENMLLWSRGKFGYDSVKVASQSVVSDNDTRSKSELLEIAKDGHNLGECDLKVIKGAFSGSNAPSRTQANCAGTGFSKYCLRHEAGHTWGLAHDGIYDSISCEKIDSGVSQMSGYKTGFNIPHLHWLGWVEENEVKQLQWDNSNSDNFVFGEHWISIRPLSINESSQEGEYPYGLVIDLRRSGNRLWLASNREDILFSPESDEYSLKEDLLLAMLSPPFELKNLKDANRWKETQIYRFIDENNPWDDELMDDIVISVVTRTDKAMLIRIEQAVVDSCSELPLASYRIVKNYSSIDELEDMGKNNLKIDFKFELNYSERDEICSKSICDVNSLKLNEWDTCYFEDDIERVNLLENNKVSIKYKDDVDNCGSLMTFKTKFSRTDQEYYRDKFSKNIICKSAYQCLYKVKDSFKFPVNGEKQEDSTQDVGIQVIYPSQWKNIIDRRNNGEEWKDGPYF